MGSLGGIEGATSGAVVVHIAVAGLCSLVVAFLAGRIGSLFGRAPLHGAFALLASSSVVLAVSAPGGADPLAFALAGFAIGGVGSMQRLAWEEYLSVKGVRYIACALPVAYLAACVVYAVSTILPRVAALSVAAVLPLASFAVMVRAVRAFPVPEERAPLPESRDRGRFSSLPLDGWRFIAVLALIYFANGVMRPSSVSWDSASLAVAPAFITAMTAVPSMIAIIAAYVLYLKRPMLCFYIAFPLMAAFSLLPPSLDPYSAGFTFCVALVSMEFWFFFIGSIMKDRVSALMCVALLRCAQWVGGALGRLVVPSILPQADSSTVVLVALVLILLTMIGFMTLSRQYAAESALANAESRSAPSAESGLERSVRLVAQRYALSPREEEILVIWAAGRTSAYIESRLFISKNTVKTHLKHIYTKTGTPNREALMQLLDTMEGRG